ncbi:MAG TPA: hypothetical protein DHV12_09945 [Thermotogae bacterium]|nr:hypothetical protein [Thermotogota bacterium]
MSGPPLSLFKGKNRRYFGKDRLPESPAETIEGTLFEEVYNIMIVDCQEVEGLIYPQFFGEAWFFSMDGKITTR